MARVTSHVEIIRNMPKVEKNPIPHYLSKMDYIHGYSLLKSIFLFSLGNGMVKSQSPSKMYYLLMHSYPLGPKEIEWLLVPPGKAYRTLTDHLISSKPLWFELAQEKWFKSNHPCI